MIEYINRTGGLLVIFADHGEEWDAQAHGHYNSLQKGVLAVPVIFFSPGKVKQKIIIEAVRSIDVGATIMELIAGNDINKLDGTSLLPIIMNRGQVTNRDAFAQQWGGRETMREFEEFQIKSIERHKLLKPLDQYLKQETVVWNGKQLLNRYDESGKLQESILINSKGQRINSKGDYRVGLGKLKQYNSLLQHESNRSLALRSEVGEQLRAMGYKVI